MNRRFKRSGGLLAVVFLVMSFIAALPAGAESDRIEYRNVNWLTYREAKEAGRDHGKPILMHFTAQYSPDCKKMLAGTYRDRRVIRYLNENFAVAMVDIERLPSLARKYKVETVPALWFLDAKGKALTSIAGEAGPEKMLRVTRYINERIYEHMDYDTWLESRGR